MAGIKTAKVREEWLGRVRENKAAFLWGLPTTSKALYSAFPTHPTAEQLCVGNSWAKERRRQEPGP